VACMGGDVSWPVGVGAELGLMVHGRGVLAEPDGGGSRAGLGGTYPAPERTAPATGGRGGRGGGGNGRGCIGGD
jgi:hypothetical protein